MARVVLGYLGPYRLLNVIHSGQFAQIWQAYHDGRQEMVGIKTLLESVRRDREKAALLRREYKIGSSLSHPRILRINSFDVDRGTPYIAMEWYAAPNLKTWIQQGTDKIAYLLPKIVEQAAEALGFFNREGWVHRDVKPDNFLVGKSGEVKLIDFSLARRNPSGLMKLLTPRSKVQGTRSYMSPEQIRGLAVDTRADVYSFGCTVYEMFAGRPPFTGTSSQDLLNKHLKASPPSLETVDKNITPEFARLVRRCLAKDPAIRPQSVEEFYSELRSIPVFRQPPLPPQVAAKGEDG